MLLNEKGYYLTILLYGLFSAISVQKVVRDKMEGIPVTDIYYGISWFSAIISILLLVIRLWNASLILSEKGFYGLAYLLSLFAAITVQKIPATVKRRQRFDGADQAVRLSISRRTTGATAVPSSSIARIIFAWGMAPMLSWSSSR